MDTNDSNFSENIEEKSSENVPVVASRDTPYILEDFLPIFSVLGLVQENDLFVSRRTIQTGSMVVNGVQQVMTQQLTHSFRFDPDFTCTIDGSYQAGIFVDIFQNDQNMLSELIYCTPENFESFYCEYTGKR